MSLRLLLACAVLAVLPIALPAETLCPGKTAGLPTRIIQNSLIVVSIRVNHGGSYDFLVDTGAHISTVDSSLASELRLQVQGTAGVSGAVSYGRQTLATLDLVAAGEKSVAGLPVVIQELTQLKAADPYIRGILGDNFLERFDLLIDNRRRLLCLDDTNTLALVAVGKHIPLTDPYGSSTDLPYTRPILVGAASPAVGGTPLNLRLDSGSNVAMLHHANPLVTNWLARGLPLSARLVTESNRFS